MIWSYFIIFAVVSVVLWAIGAWAAWRNRRILAFGATGLGLVVFFSYILIMWITLERPPLRTMGELLVCLWVLCGQKRHGDIIGHGTQRRHGLLLLGLLIWSMFTIVSIVLSLFVQPCGYLFLLLFYFKCAGGELIICRQHKA